jgi:hypothetical protein
MCPELDMIKDLVSEMAVADPVYRGIPARCDQGLDIVGLICLETHMTVTVIPYASAFHDPSLPA